MKLPAKVLSVHAIQDNPNNEVAPSGNLDSEGRILYVPKSVVIPPGTEFHISDEDKLRHLLEAGAIVILDDGWDDLVAGAADVLRREKGGGAYSTSDIERRPQLRYLSQTWDEEKDPQIRHASQTWGDEL